MISLAPILLFVYNRPDHTSKVLEALARNKEAKTSDLIIFSDGLKNDASETEKKNKARLTEIIEKETRFSRVIINQSNKNKGLAKSIIEGVTDTLKKYESVIILEDDIVVSEYFLKYMNDALVTYRNSKKVMHVSGYSLPFYKGTKQETYFFNPCSCWGWATWRDAWSCFEKNAAKQIEEIESRKSWDEFTIQNSLPTYKIQLYQNLSGEINTWAIFWYASVFLKGGTSLHPLISMTRNIGFDGSGEHCGDWESNPYDSLIYNHPVKIRRKYFYKSTKILQQLILYVEQTMNNRFYTHLSRRDKFYLFRQKFF